jgi:outer membrane protein OmpA-like peptidoglycan-associated protein
MDYTCTMSYISCSRISLIAAAACGAMLFLGCTAFAQSVQMFDDAPSIEQLRSIMIPEARSGASRTIVIQHPNSNATQGQMQPVAVTTVAPPQPPVVTTNRPSPEIAQPVTTPSAAAPPSAPATEAGAVAFHINFAFNSAVLPDSAHLMIERIAQLMKEAPDLKLRVEGHTDATGSDAYNRSLSEERALSVAQYLAAQGIAPERLILVGKGKTEPLTRDPYEPANRRVQFVRIG